MATQTTTQTNQTQTKQLKEVASLTVVTKMWCLNWTYRALILRDRYGNIDLVSPETLEHVLASPLSGKLDKLIIWNLKSSPFIGVETNVEKVGGVEVKTATAYYNVEEENVEILGEVVITKKCVGKIKETRPVISVNVNLPYEITVERDRFNDCYYHLIIYDESRQQKIASIRLVRDDSYSCLLLR